VWKQTRTRLDHWLEGFLRSEAAHFRTSQQGKRSGRVSVWESISNFFTSRKIIWALSGALALVLIVNGVLLVEYRREHPPQMQIAARPAVAVSPSEQSTENPKITPGAEGLPKTGDNINSKAGSPHGPEAGEPGAQATVPSTPIATSPVGARPTVPTLSNPSASTRPGSAAPAAKSPPAPPSVPPNPALAATINHPPELRLDPAGRLLIVMSSISPKPDGGFQFHGILLLPVAQPGSVPLDRGAEVIGVGTRSQGQTSLAITELVVQGVRYTLKDGSGVMNAQTPGAGGGVHFDRSQLLNMSPTATAVYEKAPDQTGQPEPQK
jgi:hypothetical protein